MRNEQGQFVKGFTGNPSGRPKTGTSMAEYLERALTEERDGRPRAESLIDTLLTECEKESKDNLKALNILFRVWTEVYKNQELETLKTEIQIIKERLLL